MGGGNMTIKSKLLKAYEFELMEMVIKCDSKRCTKMAMKIVVTHRIDTCDTLPAGVVPFLLCAKHAEALEKSVHSVVDRMTDQLDDGTPMTCASCGLHVQKYEDAITVGDLFDVS